MFAFAPGQARVAIGMRACGTYDVSSSRVRAGVFGLFLLVTGLAAAPAGCAPSAPRELAAAADRADHTALYTWVFEHDPSALVAWHVPAERLRTLAPDGRVSPAANHPCAQARRSHALLVLVATAETVRGRAERDVARDCGFAIFHDDGGLVIAPR